MTAPPGSRREIFEDWQRWITTVKDELVRAHFHQYLWTELRQAIGQRTPDADATFLIHYNRLYADTQMMTIRRVADVDNQTASLGRLLTSIPKNPRVLDLWREPVSLEQVETDAAELRERVLAVTTRVDKTIAHLDDAIRREVQTGDPPPLPPVTFADIRETLDFLGEMTDRYLIGLMGYSTMWTPAIQGDWQEAFRGNLFPFEPSVYQWDPRRNGFS